MNQIKVASFLTTFALAGITFLSCDNQNALVDPTGDTTVSEETYDDNSFVITDWTSETHSKKAMQISVLFLTILKFNALI
ncbi:MAG: hypothetical protein ACI9V1_002081 [Spirosomataceae bacterium]|jgi:hypothetical protein